MVKWPSRFYTCLPLLNVLYPIVRLKKKSVPSWRLRPSQSIPGSVIDTWRLTPIVREESDPPGQWQDFNTPFFILSPVLSLLFFFYRLTTSCLNLKNERLSHLKLRLLSPRHPLRPPLRTSCEPRLCVLWTTGVPLTRSNYYSRLFSRESETWPTWSHKSCKKKSLYVTPSGQMRCAKVNLNAQSTEICLINSRKSDVAKPREFVFSRKMVMASSR